MITLEDVQKISKRINYDLDEYGEDDEGYSLEDCVILEPSSFSCTVFNLGALGGSPNRYGFEQGIRWEDFSAQLKSRVKKNRDCIERIACVMSSITTDQKAAAVYLQYIGFEKIVQMNNPKHPNNELQIWVIPGADLVEFCFPRKTLAQSRFKR